MCRGLSLTIMKTQRPHELNSFPGPRTASRAISLGILGLLFALLLVPQEGFANKLTTKKKKITVTVGADCGTGVSLSNGTSGNALCASYPQSAVGMLRAHLGESIEIEAVLQYSGDPKETPPVGIKYVSSVAGRKVYDPCSTGKLMAWGALAGMNHTPLGAEGLPPGCAEALNTGDPPATDDQSAPAGSGAVPSANSEPATDIAQNTVPVSSNTVPASSRFIKGVPQCATTQYQTQGVATLWIVNSCNIAVTVQLTSDSGNAWGQTDVGPSSRAAFAEAGIGYNPRTDGVLHLFTCPKGSDPVMPNGKPFWSRNYKGEFTCLLP
jgi:hypothetical protein